MSTNSSEYAKEYTELCHQFRVAATRNNTSELELLLAELEPESLKQRFKGMKTSKRKKYIRQMKHDVINYCDETGRSLVGWLALSGNVDAMRLVINTGASPTLYKSGGEPPLHIAVRRGHLPAVRYLLEKRNGVDVNQVVNSFDGTPLHILCMHSTGGSDFVDIMRLLLNHKDINPNIKCGSRKRAPIHFAVISAHPELVLELCNHSHTIDLSAPDRDGNTALHLAVQLKDGLSAHSLFTHGARLYLTNAEGKEPRHMVEEKDPFFETFMEICQTERVGGSRTTLSVSAEKVVRPEKIRTGSETKAGLFSSKTFKARHSTSTLPLDTRGCAACASLSSKVLTLKNRTKEMEVNLRNLEEENARLREEVEKRESPFEIDYSDLVFKELVGESSFGKVFKGGWKRGAKGELEVAIKVLKEFDQRMLFQETFTMWYATRLQSHPHVVQIFGSCVSPEPLLVMEYMHGGNLFDYRRKHEMRESHILVLAKQICSAMQHLHKFNVVHNDLAMRNIMVADCEGMVVKIGDFGLARMSSEASLNTTVDNRPVAWSAPERLKEGMYSERSDVWSFGITLVELYTGKHPYPGMRRAAVEKHVLAGGTPVLDESVSGAVRELMGWCWKREPGDRPTFEELYEGLVLAESRLRRATSSASSASSASLSSDGRSVISGS